MAGNTTDVKQQRAAERVTRRRARLLFEAIRALMNTVEGRTVAWALLEKAGVFRSVFNTSGSVLAYNAGRQDFGHELMALLLQADPKLYVLMETEARAAATSDALEIEAGRTPAEEKTNGE